ncbi:MAG: hypothetical protein ACE361_07440 [Aureliella sp.]
MLRSFRVAQAFVLAVAAALGIDGAVQAQNAYELLPSSSQAAVWIRDSELLMNAWDTTELAKLTKDEAIAPFFEEKRQEIEKRFMDAGWRLNIKPEDLGEYTTGQIAIAWAAKPEKKIKPYTLTLVADVDEDPQANAAMLAQFEKQLAGQNPKKEILTHSGVRIAKYILPPRTGEFIKQESYIATVRGNLLASDDDAQIKELIDRIQGRVQGNSLADDAEFRQSRRLASLSGNAHIEYFVRPIGFAKVIRSIAGPRSKSNTDMIAALEKQGFNAIGSICGEMTIGSRELDVQHHGYVHLSAPLAKSAKLLDFPNKASGDIPKFVGANAASLLTTYWNANRAFWSAEGIVDELAGAEGVFDEVIKGIANDPNGPQIDIRQVLPNFTNDIYSVTDNKPGPADVDSRRNMMAFRLRDPASMAATLDQAMKGEPDAQLVEFQGHRIWQVVHTEEEIIDLSDDFGSDFGPPPAAPAGNQDPWLSDWAIAVHDDYLIFTSHVDMIKEAIVQSAQVARAPILETADYRRVVSAINKYFGEQPAAGWRILRSSMAYRIQYELFRRGKLKRSESMLASILDRLLQKNEVETKDLEQKINGSGLPPFAKIEPYLQPGGFIIRTTDNGWEFDGMMLGNAFPMPEKLPQITPALSQASEFGTARIVNSSSESNR